MLLSIIVPVYNVKQYLDECVQSLVDQTYRELEILLIDDGSTDGSGAMCDKWAAADERVRVIHQENRGLAAVRNVGLDAATGEVIYWVDSDDYVDVDLCRKAMEAMERENADIVVIGSWFTGQPLEPRCKVYSGFLSREEILREMMIGDLSDCVWNRLCRREIYEGIRYPEGRNFEDVSTTYKLYLKTEKIFFLPERLYYYRRREGSIVNTMSDKAVRDRFVARHQRFEDLREQYPDIAALGIKATASAGLRYYNRKLLHRRGDSVVEDVRRFFREYREEIYRTAQQEDVKRYCRSETGYVLRQYVRKGARKLLGGRA